MTDSAGSVDRTPGRLVVLAIASLVLSLLAAPGFVLALRFDQSRVLVLFLIAVPTALLVAVSVKLAKYTRTTATTIAYFEAQEL